MGAAIQTEETRVALITGGSRGIGKAITTKLVAEGIRVVINYLGNQQRAEELADQLRQSGGIVMLAQGDISDPAVAQSLVDNVVREWGRLDILVNNAGITRDNLLLRMRPEEWDAVLATNLTGMFACSKAALRSMIKHRFGRIVNISSIAGIMGNPGQTNYAASKAGMIGFSRALAREVASRNITVNVVAPGLVTTELTEGMTKSAYDGLLAQVPLGRAAEPREIAEAVWFLIESDYITGQTLVVDGGLVMD